MIPATRITAEFYDLHMLMMIGVLVMFCAVFGVIIYSVYTHRKAAGPHLNTAGQFHQYAAVEIIWTVIP